MSAVKTCLIIGGGRGMGAATAKEMSNRGYKLALMSPTNSCEKLASELGGIAKQGVAESLEDIKAIIELMSRYTQQIVGNTHNMQVKE